MALHNVLDLAFQKYGHRAQLLKLAEESMELASKAIKAANELELSGEFKYPQLAEEMADVQIVMDQFTRNTDLGFWAKRYREDKITRLMKKLETVK